MATIKEKIVPTWHDVDDAAFLLAPLTPYDAIDLRNEITFRKGKLIMSGEGIRIAGNAVLNWRNVTDEKNEPIAFTRDGYDSLDRKYLEGVAAEVFKRAFLSELEKKTSSLQ